MIPSTPHLLSHLNWWSQKQNIRKGRSLQNQSVDLVITTDASKVMYGGHLGSQFVQGAWTIEQQACNINVLERKQ